MTASILSGGFGNCQTSGPSPDLLIWNHTLTWFQHLLIVEHLLTAKPYLPLVCWGACLGRYSFRRFAGISSQGESLWFWKGFLIWKCIPPAVTGRKDDGHKKTDGRKQSSAQHSDYSQQHYLKNLQVAKRLDLNCSQHKKKKEMIIMWWDRSVTLVIILLGKCYYINNHMLYKMMLSIKSKHDTSYMLC